MYTIDQALSTFLEVQQKRLSPRTFGDYDEVIHLFRMYLNDYAYQYLAEFYMTEFKVGYAEDEAYFVKNYGLEYLKCSTYSEFVEYYIIRKVSSAGSYVEKTIRVLKKLTKWLLSEKHIDVKHYERLMECLLEMNTDIM